MWSNMEQLGIKCEVKATDKNKKCECNAQNICILVNLSDTSTSTTLRPNITLPNTCTSIIVHPVCGYDDKLIRIVVWIGWANIPFKYGVWRNNYY